MPADAPSANDQNNISASSTAMLDLARSIARVRAMVWVTPDETMIRERIDVLLAQSEGQSQSDWNDVYEIERLSIFLLSPQAVHSDLILRLREVVSAQSPRASSLHEAYAALNQRTKPEELNGEAALSAYRFILLEIIEEIQWCARKYFITRQNVRMAAKRIVKSWIITFLVFGLPYIYIYIMVLMHGSHDLRNWTGLVCWSALSAGLMGALFSRLIFIQSNWTSLSFEQVNDSNSWTSIILRGSIGMCGALFIFLLLRSGVVSGDAFPKFEELQMHYYVLLRTEGQFPESAELRVLLPSKHLALLVVWCFIAGFSERLVPDILASTERKFATAATR